MTSRTIPSAIATDLAAGNPEITYYVELLFDDPNKLYFSTKTESVTVGGTTYLPAGGIVGFGPVSENITDGDAQYEIVFSGLEASIVPLALAEDFQWRAGRVLLGTQNATSLMLLYSGPMSSMPITVSDGFAIIRIMLASKRTGGTKARPKFFGPEELRKNYPTDTFFDYTTDLYRKVVNVW